MKKNLIYIFILTNIFIFKSIDVDAFTTKQKYFECTRWEIVKGQLKTADSSNKGSGKECSETFKNDKKPTSLTECYEKSSSGFLGIGSKYNIYSADLKYRVYYKDSPLNADYDNCHGDDAKYLNSCEDIGTNTNLCAHFSSCQMQNNTCVSLNSWQSTDACENVNISGGGKTECEALGCSWSASTGCSGAATIKDSTHPDNQNNQSSNNGEAAKIDYNIINNDCSGVIGSFSEDLRSFLKIFRIIAPIMVMGLSVYEYLIAVINKDADQLKKCNGRLIKRIILMAVLFFLPSLVDLLLKLLGDTYGLCL